MSSEHPIEVLSRRFPQLLLPVKEGMSGSEEFREVVLRGKMPDNRPDFSFDPADTLSFVQTPAGEVSVAFFNSREDFVHAFRALAFRCEPREIPASNGASTIRGLINWEKLRPHVGLDFNEFIADKNNYLDCLILLSNGAYSAVSPEMLGIDGQEWLRKSLMIRKYHELTHFISGKLFPENKEALRDELIADMIGLIAAFGEYNTNYARVFLGTEGEIYRNGGRLQNYCEDAPAIMAEVNRKIEILGREAEKRPKNDVFEFLEYIERNKIVCSFDEN